MTKNGLAVSIATIWMRQTMPQSAMDEWSHYVKGCGEQAVLSAARSNLLKIKKL
jgi:hypothetical protein